MASPPPVQRKTIGRTVIAVLPIGAVLAVCRLAVLRGVLLRLATGDERRQPFHVRFILRRMLRARLKLLRLRLMRRLMLRLVRLLVLRLARIERLRLARREWFAADMGLLVIVVVIAVIGEIAARIAAGLLLLVIGLGLAKLFLGGCDQAEIMLGVLIIIFGADGISRTLRVSGELEIFFGDVRRGAADFYVLPV